MQTENMEEGEEKRGRSGSPMDLKKSKGVRKKRDYVNQTKTDWRGVEHRDEREKGIPWDKRKQGREKGEKRKATLLS